MHYKLYCYKSDISSIWLNEVSNVALQQAMLHLGLAYTNFFRVHKGYPTFKKKQNKQSFTLTKFGFRFKNNQLYIAKSKEPLKIAYSRPLPSDPSQVTISRTTTGKYYASFLCEYIAEKTNGQDIIGIDLGLKDFLVTSKGEHVANPKHFVTAQKHLKRLQQSLSRKKRSSH